MTAKPIDIKTLYTGSHVRWKKPGKRYAITCMVLAVSAAAGRVIVIDDQRKRRNVPIEQLEKSK